MHSRIRVTLFIAGAIGLAACKDLGDPVSKEYRYGSIVVDANATSATTLNATAKGVFFATPRTAAVTSSITSQNDACTTTNVDTTTVEITGTLNAGDALSLQVGSTTIPMTWVAGASRYDTPATPFTYTSGNTVTLNVPGNGTVYPAGSVSVLLAEPLVAPPVTLSATQRTITWNASTTNTSAVLLSLRFANPANSGYGNQQIVCQLKDDGSITLPEGSLSSFLASPSIYRSLTLSRFRTSEVSLDDRTLLHINSQTTIPVTLQ